MDKAVNNILIPGKWRDKFEMKKLKERGKEMNMILTEKKECVPDSIKGMDYVLNGYMEPMEIIDYPLRGKLMYITFLRRRWKQRGENESYFNTYTFHRPGMKTTDEFGDFLKGLDREEFDELCGVWPVLRNLR